MRASSVVLAFDRAPHNRPTIFAAIISGRFLYRLFSERVNGRRQASEYLLWRPLHHGYVHRAPDHLFLVDKPPQISGHFERLHMPLSVSHYDLAFHVLDYLSTCSPFHRFHSRVEPL